MDLINEHFQEQYSHVTSSIPYSLHHTMIPKSESKALYPHWHHELELFYVHQGQVRFTIEQETYDVHEGEALFIPSHLLHKASKDTTKGCSFYAVVFSSEILTNSLPYPNAPNYMHPSLFSGIQNVVHITTETNDTSILLQYIKQLCFLYSVADEECSLEVIGLLLCIWQKLYPTIFSKAEKDLQSQKTVAQLQNSIYYMQKHYTQEITLTDLAKISILSKGYYCTAFKTLYGLTPFEYLNRYRIKKACNDLIHSEMTVIEIMYSCGINNVSYFNRLFKKYMGLSPTQYKKNLMKKQESST